MVNKKKKKNNNNNSSNSLVFGRWPQTKIWVLTTKERLAHFNVIGTLDENARSNWQAAVLMDGFGV